MPRYSGQARSSAITGQNPPAGVAPTALRDSGDGCGACSGAVLVRQAGAVSGHRLGRVPGGTGARAARAGRSYVHRDLDGPAGGQTARWHSWPAHQAPHRSRVHYRLHAQPTAGTSVGRVAVFRSCGPECHGPIAGRVPGGVRGPQAPPRQRFKVTRVCGVSQIAPVLPVEGPHPTRGHPGPRPAPEPRTKPAKRTTTPRLAGGRNGSGH